MNKLLGYNDSTAIWFFPQCGQEIDLLEYYENSGEPLTHYLTYLKNKPHSYGKHLVSHDAAVHEYSSGLSRVEVDRSHGISFTVVVDIGLNEGIDAARNILHRCWFDEAKCAKEITALESYKKERNDKHGCWASAHYTILQVIVQMPSNASFRDKQTEKSRFDC